MKRIFRRISTVDTLGRILSARVEELSDDEAGTIEETYSTALTCCEACGRSIEKVNEVRGRCSVCGQNTCSICSGFCAVCNRSLCDRCRVGFAEKSISVCSACLPLLERRQEYQDKLIEEKLDFERTMAVCNAQLKLIQLYQHNKGTLSRVILTAAELKAARKLAKMEKQLKRELDHGK